MKYIMSCHFIKFIIQCFRISETKYKYFYIIKNPLSLFCFIFDMDFILIIYYIFKYIFKI